MTSKGLYIIATLSIAFFSITASGQIRNDIPSCYGVLNNGSTPDPPERELIVLVDQTVAPPEDLKIRIHEQVHRFLQPGDWVTIARFSAFVQDKYTTVAFTGLIDKDLTSSTRYNTSKKNLMQFDNCLKQQNIYSRAAIDKHLKDSFGDKKSEIPNTELIGGLKNITDSLLNQTNSSRKVILIISDMLENSETSSFYKNGAVRIIDPDSEISKFSSADLLANFKGYDIYVMGAGLNNTGEYKSADKMRRIRKFWANYFSLSNGKLAGWGQPDLLGSIK